MKKKEAFKFFNKKTNVDTYSKIYKKNDFVYFLDKRLRRKHGTDKTKVTE